MHGRMTHEPYDRGCTGEFSAGKSKKLFLVPRTQPKLGARAMPNVAFSQLPPLLILNPISSNAIFIEIDPHGKEFATNIQRAHGIGNTVARGHHFCLPLHCQNHELSIPSGEKFPTEHQKHNNQHNDDVTSTFVCRRHLMQQARSPPPQPTTPLPPQRPPQHTFNLG
jgi:hypothetical protein